MHSFHKQCKKKKKNRISPFYLYACSDRMDGFTEFQLEKRC